MLRSAIVFILSLCVYCAQAQISEFGIANTSSSKETLQKKSTPLGRENATTPIQLPFWDDFSTSGTTPDTLRWRNGEAVLINNGLAINAPSLGIASFDGVNAQGFGYSANASSTGKTDSLTSCPIALGGLGAADNVFFNFYYQYGGNGDSPDNSDSIRVDFLNSDGQWINVWPQGASLSRDSDEFEQVIIPLTDAQFFFDGFQFRFQSFGRQSGPFDIWNLDYVYLNDGESLALSFPDRTISSPLSTIFDEFYSLPARHFQNDIISNPTFNVGSVDDPTDPPQPYSFIGEVNITSTLNGSQTTENISLGPFTSRQIEPGDINNEFIGIFSDEVNVPENQDTVDVAVEFILRASDNELPIPGSTGDFDPILFDTLDFRFNDTLRSNYILADYYAYDDGSAELAAGLNFSGDQLTYQFNLAKDTADNVVAVDMYFPFIGTEPSGKVVDVVILKDLRNEPTSVLYSERITLGRTETLNEFIRYELRRSTVVSDSFYIGYRQLSEGRLGIGLDKSNDSGDRMFFNLDGVWRQNQLVRGSLMLRPVFGEEKIVTSISPDQLQKDNFNLYPNPTRGVFSLEGQFEELEVFDIHGRKVNFKVDEKSSNTLRIDISNVPQGLYLLKIRNGSKSEVLKLLKQ